MIKPSRVVFISDELEDNFNSLPENDFVKKSIIRAIKDLKQNAFMGIHIPKMLIPKKYIHKWAIKNIDNLRELSKESQIVMEGMINESHSISSNVEPKFKQERVASLVKAIEILERNYLTGNDFSRKSEHAQELKNYFISKLGDYDTTILQEKGRAYSPAILAFRFNVKNNRDIVEKLQRQGIFTSYIHKTNNVRVSFDVCNTKQDIDKYFTMLSQIIQY